MTQSTLKVRAETHDDKGVTVPVGAQANFLQATERAETTEWSRDTARVRLDLLADGHLPRRTEKAEAELLELTWQSLDAWDNTGDPSTLANALIWARQLWALRTTKPFEATTRKSARRARKVARRTK